MRRSPLHGRHQQQVERMTRHLKDDELLELLVQKGSELNSTGRSSNPSAQAHVSHCAVCASRSASVEAFLRGLEEASDIAFEETFSVERQTTQKERLLRRLRRLVEPGELGRVLMFPAMSWPTVTKSRRARKWLVGAMAASLLIGIAIGQFIYSYPNRSLIGGDETFAFPIATAESNDAFMDRLELVLSSPQVPELSPLDEITPRVREVAVNVW